jgi:hypothetical protein
MSDVAARPFVSVASPAPAATFLFVRRAVLLNGHQAVKVPRDRRARLLQPGFSLTGHLCGFGALVLAALAGAGWLARRARPQDLWIVPAYVVVGNVAEYLMHRLLMHRPLWPRRFYQGHTLVHHRAFHNDSMEIESWRELGLVMMPWFSIAVFFVAVAPVGALVGWVWGQGAAGLFLGTAVVTFVSYEALHALYHFPPRVLDRLALGKSRLFQLFSRNHRHHHRLVRMRRVNFNISLPLCDRIFATLEDEATWQAERERRARARGAENESGSENERERDRREGADPEAA